MNLDSSKASHPDHHQWWFLRTVSLNLHTHYKFFTMYLNVSCFPDFWKVSLVVPVLTNVGERSTAKNCHPVTFFSVIKSLKNL